MKPGPRRDGGRTRTAFTLLEVVVAMAVLGIVVLALYSVLLSSFRTVQLSREELRATQIMVELMDTLRLYSWDQITDPTFTPKKFSISYDPVGATNGTGRGGTMYNCVMKVAGGPAGVDYKSEMKTVTLDIDWVASVGTTNANGKALKLPSYNRTFTSFVTKNGLQNYVYY
jgi:prepilin-type N-terminal cleavage/methylation domain-containing protein